jgi:hypothetical protein
MLSLPQREEVTRRLVDGVPGEGRRFDILLFSGGGNDLVGDQFCIWLKKFQASMPVSEVIDTRRFDAVLQRDVVKDLLLRFDKRVAPVEGVEPSTFALRNALA